MMGAVFIAYHRDASDPPVGHHPLLVIHFTNECVQALQYALTDAGWMAKPDRRAKNQDVRCKHLFPDHRPIVTFAFV